MVGALVMLLMGELISLYAGVPVLIMILTAAAALLTVSVLRRKIWFWYYFLLFFMILGFFRMQDSKKESLIQSDGIYQIIGKINKIVEKDGYRQLYVYGAKGQNQVTIPGILLHIAADNPAFLQEYLPGDRIRAQVTPEEYETARNPGNFDAKRYYETMNITCYGWCDDVEVVQKNNNPVTKGIFHLKERLKNVYEQIGTGEDTGVYCSLVLGDKSLLDVSVKLLYQANGISHILAISGVKTLNLVLPRGAEKPVNWAFLRLHKGKKYIIKRYF